MSLTDYALVTLPQARDYLKIDATDTDSDSVIEQLIEAATQRTEDYCGTYWVQREIEETHIGDGVNTRLWLYRAPATEISSVELDGTALVEDTDYTVRLFDSTILHGGLGWPRGDEVVVTYTVGCGADRAAAQLAEPTAVAAVMMCVAIWAENRLGLKSEMLLGVDQKTYSEVTDLPQAVKAMLMLRRKRL